MNTMPPTQAEPLPDTYQDLLNLPYAYDMPKATGALKCHPEDFIVAETLSFELSGEGEHLFLYIQKKGLNTEEVVNNLAKFTSLPSKAIGYAGKKDKQALTSQWFSLHLPGKSDPDFSEFENDQIQILKSSRHHKKLKKGNIKHNAFQITIREVKNSAEIEDRIMQLKQSGIPNYFGEQRFGIQHNNLHKAHRLFSGQLKLRKKPLKGIYLSAVRALLFNRVLAYRIKHQNWLTPVAGDVIQLDGCRSQFLCEQSDQDITDRIKRFDIHPTGPLWGIGKSMVNHDALDIEQAALINETFWQKGLEKHGLKQDRRALRVPVSQLSYELLNHDTLCLSFTLPTGSYATSAIREIIHYNTQ